MAVDFTDPIQVQQFREAAIKQGKDAYVVDSYIVEKILSVTPAPSTVSTVAPLSSVSSTPARDYILNSEQQNSREYGSILIGLLFVLFVLVSFISGKKVKIEKWFNGFVEKILPLMFIVIKWAVYLFVGYFILKGMMGIFNTKYEGMSAEEWANEADFLEDEYNSLLECMEEFDDLTVNEQINYGGVLNYCR